MKKLLTADKSMIQQVENVLKEKGVKYAKYSVEKKEIIAVLNKHGNVLVEAVNTVSTKEKYHLGVLRNHPECSVPGNLLKKLNAEGYSKFP